jgi:hypothetical protein
MTRIGTMRAAELERDDFGESPSRSNLLSGHDLFRPAFARRSIKPK